MKRTLFIFEHKKGFFLSIENQILIILTAVLFLLVFLERSENFDFGNFVTYIGVIWMLTLVGILISNFFSYERKKGKFKGKLELEENSIRVNKVIYELEEISDILVNAFDYEGRFINATSQFTRHLSNGLDNEIIIKLKNGTEVKCHFFQSKGHRIKNFRDMLISYHLNGKMSWLNLLNVLEIEKYKEIQEFKRTLKIKKIANNA